VPHIAPRLATTQVESIWTEAAEKRKWDLSGLQEPDGGFTKNPRTGTEIKSGLSVGGYGTKVEIPVAQLKQHHIDRYMRENHDSLTSGSDRAIGAWHDPDTHHVALDVAKVFPQHQRDEAIAAGHRNKQKSIADLDAIHRGDWDNGIVRLATIPSPNLGANAWLEGHAKTLATHAGVTRPDTDYSKFRVNTPFAKTVAKAYHALPTDDPAAHPAYKQMAKEVEHQYKHLTGKMGVKVDTVHHDPYPTAQHMRDDVVKNKHLSVLATDAPGSSSHPYFSNEQNNHFRAVHDVFGHAATGRGFDRHGEEAAWHSHASMFSPLARRAMTTETRGQNSAMTQSRGKKFPPQKVGLLPESMSRTAAKELRHCIAGRAQMDRAQL
jgi:hypothetical protein